MKRILVADDERPVSESISLIVKRELASDFEIVGNAISGKEAIEKAAALAPDIILMDVRMPGISGLEAIREIRKRGLEAAFILVTAYERFDIAREAVELGVLEYLLKPLTKEKLTQALRNAAAFVDRRAELDIREIEHREREEDSRVFAEAALLDGIVLGEAAGELERRRSALGIAAPYGLAVAVAFLPEPGSPEPEADSAALYRRFREALRYKTEALVGSFARGRCLVLLPLAKEVDAARSIEELESIVFSSFEEARRHGLLCLGYGYVEPFAELATSWTEAMRELFAPPLATSHGAFDTEGAIPFEEDATFLDELLGGNSARAQLSLERLLCALDEGSSFSSGRWRIAVLLGSAYRSFSRRGLMLAAEAFRLLDFGDLFEARDLASFQALVRGRFSNLIPFLKSDLKWSQPVAKGMAFLKENYGKQVNLELAADAIGISPNRLSRLFVEETGRAFTDYLIGYRIERAKELLLLPDASIKSVSLSCGYPDPNYFSRLFKKVTGITPTAFSQGKTEDER
jgi:two-component system, response regulator YesN